MARTDRLQAQIERGFEALEEGDVERAAELVELCRRIDRQNSDVIQLAAAVADASGDIDDALAQYEQLSQLRPDDPMPRIQRARLQLHGLGDADAALDTLEAAFDFIDEEEDLLEAIYVKADALIARDDLEEARAALGELASSVIDDPHLALDLAELALAAEDAQAALRWIEAARTRAKEISEELAGSEEEDEAHDESHIEGDALHLLGRVYEAADDRAKMIEAWQQVRTMDAETPGAIEITEDELLEIANAALGELPEKVRAKLSNVPILVHDAPTEEMVADGMDPRLLGVFQGVPMSDDGELAPTVTNILLFKSNLERASADEEHLADEIRITVLHETAHYFGLDEDDLEALGLD